MRGVEVLVVFEMDDIILVGIRINDNMVIIYLILIVCDGYL